MHDFTIVGETPLLIHADDVEMSDRIKQWQQDPENRNQSVPGDDRSPPWTWQTRLYHNGECLTVPVDNLSSALLEAGKTMILKRSTTYKELSQVGLFFHVDEMPIFTNGNTVPLAAVLGMRDLSFAEQSQQARSLGFSLFVKRAKVGNSKHVRVRARFDEWQLNGRVEIISKDMTVDAMKQLFNIAGFYKGLCDWRPSSPRKPGRFGRFKVEFA